MTVDTNNSKILLQETVSFIKTKKVAAKALKKTTSYFFFEAISFYEYILLCYTFTDY